MDESLDRGARPGGARAILYGGLLAGALDLGAAIVLAYVRGSTALRLNQSIASGLLGRAAYEHGLATASLGVLLHFLMMFVICAIFYLASSRLPVLARRPVLSGVLYGAGVYLVMNFVVLPLSAFPHEIAYTPQTVAIGGGVIIACVGLPIALVARRYRVPRVLPN